MCLNYRIISLFRIFSHSVPLWSLYFWLLEARLFWNLFRSTNVIAILHQECRFSCCWFSITYTSVNYVCFCFYMKILMETYWLRLEIYKHIVAVLLTIFLWISCGSSLQLLFHKCLCCINSLWHLCVLQMYILSASYIWFDSELNDSENSSLNWTNISFIMNVTADTWIQMTKVSPLFCLCYLRLIFYSALSFFGKIKCFPIFNPTKYPL